MVISPYISEGSGLKLRFPWQEDSWRTISPYISEGSGLKHFFLLSAGL